MNRTASPQQRTLLLTAVAAVGATTALTLSGCAVDYLPANNDSGANRSQSASSGAGQSASSGAGQSASSGITSHPQTPEGTGDSDDALDG